MTPIHLFISSVQREFAVERAALRDYLRGDVLMRRFFEPFLFEDVPAADRRADEVYLDEVRQCDLYLGLLGDDYGFEDEEGISPTEREFARATELHKPRLIFVKCAHFHGTEVAKPIPSYQVYKGTAFEVVDQAVDFVLSKINLAVGTRAASTQAPVTYEMPQEVVREAIVNAVAHRDYTSNGSVQVMLFADRPEVWNPGTLPPSLTLEKLRQPHGSVPANPLLAESLYLAKYIERMGTGTGDMIARCRHAGLSEPEFALTDGFVTTIWRKPDKAFDAVGRDATLAAGEVTGEVTGEVAGEVTGEVTGEVARLLLVCHGEMTRREMREMLLLKGDDNFRRLYLVPALEAGLIEMTIPDKPRSRLQKYRLSATGTALLDSLRKGRPHS